MWGENGRRESASARARAYHISTMVGKKGNIGTPRGQEPPAPTLRYTGPKDEAEDRRAELACNKVMTAVRFQPRTTAAWSALV